MIALFGGFGGFCYVFFSIQDGSFSEKKEILYGFWGFLIIILFLDTFLLLPLIAGSWQSQKFFELSFLLVFFIVTLTIAFFFNLVFYTIEENYENRISIINFLKKNDQKNVVSHFFDSLSREIIRKNDIFVTYVFLLMVSMIFFGIIMNFNPLSIISMILFSLAIFNGYSRLILLKEPPSNIELIKQNPSLLISSINYTPPVRLSNIFILKESNGFLTILTKKENDRKIITFSKNCICSIQDNEYEIFEEKNYPLFNLIIKRILRFVLSIISFYVAFVILKFFFLPTQDWIIFLSVLSFSIIVGFCFIYRIRVQIDDQIEKIINFLKSL